MAGIVPFSLTGKRVWVAGATGMLGNALCERLRYEKCEVIITSREKLNLCRQSDVENWMSQTKPQVIFFADGISGGIRANEIYPGDFIYKNTAMAVNVINSAHLFSVEKLLMLGASCIYPRRAEQPICEEQLLTGALEPTNESYAIAKIAGVKLCQAFRRQYRCDFISVVPANLYGPRDNFDPEESHVIPGLISRIDANKESGDPVVIWGTGKPRREFMFVDDAADALVFLMKQYSDESIINIGSGNVCSISQLVELLVEIIDFKGSVEFDVKKPDGMPHKQLNTSRLRNMGWKPGKSLREGLKITYDWYLDEIRHE